eukprot:TRINITY_DN9176_c0_g1_i1.p1 TRINITY_DN9176_c0_g1~~TRINITY_DN9176_c0_g1_i1.p1  ORF type:complete len:224 (+),score=73.11 TRINITY_DN9176_c0_g1_i1:57-728(+)
MASNVELVEQQQNEKLAEDMCIKINERLESAENSDSLTEELLNQSLAEFKQCLVIDPECVEAMFGMVYVYGHLDMYEEGLQTLKEIEEMEVEDPRIEEMRNNLEEMKKENQQPLANIPGLVEDGEMTEKFIATLVEIFQRFDVDKDNSLSDAELNKFHQVVNGTPIAKQTLAFLHENFEVDAKGYLTQDGFIAFYLSQTLGDASETLNDLKQLGYNDKLEKIK